MHDILFIILAGLTVISAFLVVANPFSRNPVTSALFLVITLISLSGLYILLGAYFLGAVQILVYAGAVMVLFLFVVMLLNVKEEEVLKTSLGRWIAAGVAATGLASFLIGAYSGASQKLGSMGNSMPGEAKSLGKILFTQYLLPFEIMSILLLVAMVGVVLLSKRNLK